MTVFASITAAMVASLQAGPAVCQQVHRSRVRPGAAAWTQMVVIRLLDVALEPFAIRGGPMNADTRVAVECHARAVTGVSAEAAVDALLGAVYQRLAQDPTLGGLLSDLQPLGLTYDFDAEGEPVGVATLTYIARHRVQGGTLE